jgi:hypothetical protein
MDSGHKQLWTVNGGPLANGAAIASHQANLTLFKPQNKKSNQNPTRSNQKMNLVLEYLTQHIPRKTPTLFRRSSSLIKSHPKQSRAIKRSREKNISRLTPPIPSIYWANPQKMPVKNAQILCEIKPTPCGPGLRTVDSGLFSQFLA